MLFPEVMRYRGLLYWSPVSPARMESLTDLMELERGDRVLDLGCGQGELLLRLVERHGVRATGVDRSAQVVAAARARAAGRVPGADIEFIACDARDFAGAAQTYGCISLIGGPRIGKTFADTLAAVVPWLRPGGYVLAGEMFWQKPPEPAYLAALGLSEDEAGSHPDNIATGRAAGLTLLYACASNRDEWDHFEGRVLHNVETLARDHMDDPAVAETVVGRRAFFDAQMRWGRDTMGFGLYLFRSPAL